MRVSRELCYDVRYDVLRCYTNWSLSLKLLSCDMVSPANRWMEGPLMADAPGIAT